MEAFGLLKYWRGGGVAGDNSAKARTTTASTTTILSSVTTSETDEEDNDNGPFFDLEFSLPDEEKNGEENAEDGDTNSDGSESENGDRIDPNVSVSPSDDLFFKGSFVPVEAAETNLKSQFPVSILKSATKFRVLMLKLKPKATLSQKTESKGSGSKNLKQRPHGKFFTVKLKVEMPIVSLFNRENGSKDRDEKAEKQSSEESALDEKRFSKDKMQRYLKKVKPLYVRASKRYGEKLRFSGQLSFSGGTKAGLEQPPSTAAEKSPLATKVGVKSEMETMEVAEVLSSSNVKSLKQGNIPAGLRVVYKHLGKSRSASAAVDAAASGAIASKRRDDTLLQQQDGIQSAILHCKTSFKAFRDSESSILSRSVSDQSHEISIKMSPASSSGEATETCILKTLA